MYLPFKRILPVLLLLGIATASITACFRTPDAADSSDTNSIQSYKDIPGITEDEIKAIAALRAERQSLTYGCEMTTESFVLPDGTRSGFMPLFRGLLTELFGIPFVHQCHDRYDLKNEFDRGAIDFINETRAANGQGHYYATDPIAWRSLKIFTVSDATGINHENDIDGLTIGFYKNTAIIKSIQDFYPSLNFYIVEVETPEEVIRLLQWGYIDAFVSEAVHSLPFDDYEFIVAKDFFPLVYVPVSMVTNRPELAPIISVMDKYLAAGGIDKLQRLYDAGSFEYARYRLYKSFTPAEAAYLNNLIASGRRIRVAFDPDSYPVSFFNEKYDEFQGIAPDILAVIAALTGLEFEVVTDKNSTWHENLEKLRRGDVSLISHLMRHENMENDFLWSHTPYASTQRVFLSRMDYPDLKFYQIEQVNVGIVRGTIAEQVYNKWFPNSSNLRLYDLSREALDALESGEIDLL